MSIVAVIGLGYVGLPLLCLAREKGHKALGYDIDQKKLDMISRRTPPLKDEIVEKFLKTSLDLELSTDPNFLRHAEYLIICVPTPVHEDFTPNLDPLISATKTVSTVLSKGQTVIVESTIYPGTTEELVLPILEKTGLKAGNDFFLAHCPERIDPGNQNWTLRNIPRVCGAYSEEGLKKTVKFYESIIEGEITPLSSLKAAEACKVVENSFRDINIAFVNELAISFNILGIDILEVISGASTKPFAFIPHYPGAGVGGHCIPVDPYYLIKKAEDLGFEHEFLKLARKINNHMPYYVIELLDEVAKELSVDLQEFTIGLLGISFKKNIDDVRNSPYFQITKSLENRGIKHISYDPWALKLSSSQNLSSLLDQSDFLILITAHKEFEEIAVERFKQTGILGIIDGRNVLDKKEIKKLGIAYRGIGRK